jgi:hypothetical protein
MRHRSDVHYLLEANSYWLRYTKLWGPVLLLNLCDGGQLQTLLPSITARLTPDMQERILLIIILIRIIKVLIIIQLGK